MSNGVRHCCFHSHLLFSKTFEATHGIVALLDSTVILLQTIIEVRNPFMQ